MSLLVPIGRSTEKFIKIIQKEHGVVLQYVRKSQVNVLYGKSYFLPSYIAQTVIKSEYLEAE